LTEQPSGQPKIHNGPGGDYRIVVFGTKRFGQCAVSFWFGIVQTIQA
jgi:hypothetical protein